MPPRATRTIRVKFDGDEKGLIAAAAKAGIAVEAFEKQANKSTKNLAKSSALLGDGLIDALGALPSQLKGAAIVAAVGIGAVMAPALAGVLISGILLAVGSGVLAAGIVGAAKSPKVVNAWKKFGRQAAVVFERFSKPFIEPLVRAAKVFGAALARAEPIIRRIGQAAAPIVDKLSVGLAGLFENLMPGILVAVQAAVPLFDTLAANLPGIGGSLALFFETLARGVPNAQIFFDRFLKWVQDILPKLGGFLVWLSDLGIKMEAFAKGPQFTALVSALTSFKDDTLAGVKTGLDNIKISIDSNSETWRNLAKDIEGAVRNIGPVVKWLADLIGQSIGAAIDWFATLYEAARKVWSILTKVYEIIKAIVTGADRLPGNLSGGNTHVIGGKIPGRAYGGPVTAGRSYLVGERGVPEIFTARQSGYITPTDMIGSAEGPLIIENHIEIGGEVVRVVRTEISESDRRTKRAVLAGAGAR